MIATESTIAQLSTREELLSFRSAAVEDINATIRMCDVFGDSGISKAIRNCSSLDGEISDLWTRSKSHNDLRRH